MTLTCESWKKFSSPAIFFIFGMGFLRCSNGWKSRFWWMTVESMHPVTCSKESLVWKEVFRRGCCYKNPNMKLTHLFNVCLFIINARKTRKNVSMLISWITIGKKNSVALSVNQNFSKGANSVIIGNQCYETNGAIIW